MDFSPLYSLSLLTCIMAGKEKSSPVMLSAPQAKKRKTSKASSSKMNATMLPPKEDHKKITLEMKLDILHYHEAADGPCKIRSDLKLATSTASQ